MNDPIAATLRIAMGSTIVLAMVAAGFLHRSPWIVALAIPAYTVLYALGKWNTWTAAWRAGGLKQIGLAVLTTLPIQAVIAAIFYLIGLGIGRLIAPSPIATLSIADVLSTVGLFTVSGVVSALIIRLERRRGPSAGGGKEVASEAMDTVQDAPELDIDPTPLTLETFFKSPGYWRQNAARDALERRDKMVEKQPRAARDEMIAAAEARLGVRLPDTLRKLYGVMNGGYVGWMYVPLKAKPRPLFEDWRGAFSIDYSSLVPIERLRTVADHYDDFTHDPEELPADADRRLILQARYGDMTLLDYTRGPEEPRVLLVDYDKRIGEDPIDIAFDTFDDFFAALRRERAKFAPPSKLSPPLGDVPPDDRPRHFWGEGDSHAFYRNALHRKDGSEPKLAADEALVADTQRRLGVVLPPSLVALWCAKNGGGVSHRFIPVTATDGVTESYEAMRFPVPLEYMTSLAALSDRIVFPPGEMSWKERHPGAHRLIVLEVDHGRATLLDYRDRPDDGDPAVLLVKDLDNDRPEDAIRFELVDDLLTRLCFQIRNWDDVAKSIKGDPGANVAAN